MLRLRGSVIRTSPVGAGSSARPERMTVRAASLLRRRGLPGRHAAPDGRGPRRF